MCPLRVGDVPQASCHQHQCCALAIRECARDTSASPDQKWFGVSRLPIHPAFYPLFKLPTEQPVERTKDFLEAMLAASPITYSTHDDPPIYLVYGGTAAIDADLSPGR